MLRTPRHGSPNEHLTRADLRQEEEIIRQKSDRTVADVSPFRSSFLLSSLRFCYPALSRRAFATALDIRERDALTFRASQPTKAEMSEKRLPGTPPPGVFALVPCRSIVLRAAPCDGRRGAALWMPDELIANPDSDSADSRRRTTAIRVSRDIFRFACAKLFAAPRALRDRRAVLELAMRNYAIPFCSRSRATISSAMETLPRAPPTFRAIPICAKDQRILLLADPANDGQPHR